MACIRSTRRGRAPATATCISRRQDPLRRRAYPAVKSRYDDISTSRRQVRPPRPRGSATAVVVRDGLLLESPALRARSNGHPDRQGLARRGGSGRRAGPRTAVRRTASGLVQKSCRNQEGRLVYPQMLLRSTLSAFSTLQTPQPTNPPVTRVGLARRGQGGEGGHAPRYRHIPPNQSAPAHRGRATQVRCGTRAARTCRSESELREPGLRTVAARGSPAGRRAVPE